MQERQISSLKKEDRHDSMRGYFAYHLHEAMSVNPKIWFLTGDLGYGFLDKIKRDYPDRFINVGASEVALLGVGVGLALEGKIPFVYSITPFLLARPYEIVRNYINHEQIPVKLIGGGRDNDYAHDGFSHDATDAKQILSNFPNIKQLWPQSKDEVFPNLWHMIQNNKPTFISLTR